MEDNHENMASVGSNIQPEGFHKKVFIYPTLRCPLLCKHCAIQSGLHRTEEMHQSILEKCIYDIINSKKVDAVVFSGGEPFLVMEKIRSAISVLNASNIAVTVQTSAYWADTPSKAARVLSSLPGINQLIMSVDEFHQEFVPIHNVGNACIACAELGINIRIHTLSYETKLVERKLRQIVPKSVSLNLPIYQNQSIHLVGRGRNLRNHAKVLYDRVFPDRQCFSCSVAFILPTGRVTACGGDMQWNDCCDDYFNLGDLKKNSFQEISLLAERNYLIHAMRLWGPKKFADMVITHGFAAKLSLAYLRHNICDLCCDLFSKEEVLHIIKHEIERDEYKREIALMRALMFGELDMFNSSSTVAKK